jgi:hypothetical protein
MSSALVDVDDAISCMQRSTNSACTWVNAEVVDAALAHVVDQALDRAEISTHNDTGEFSNNHVHRSGLRQTAWRSCAA